MKYLVRVFLFNVFALWFTSQLLPTLLIAPGWLTIVFAGFILSLLMLFVRPMLKILFIPINIITFGLFSWVVNVVVIFLLTFFVPEVQVKEWQFPGGTWAGFVAPSVHIPYWAALIITTFVITVIAQILHKVSEN